MATTFKLEDARAADGLYAAAGWLGLHAVAAEREAGGFARGAEAVASVRRAPRREAAAPQAARHAGRQQAHGRNDSDDSADAGGRGSSRDRPPAVYSQRPE